MSLSSSRDADARPQKQTEPLLSALQTGGVTGLFGVCVGGSIGILRSAHPGLAAAWTGAQCFVLGSSFSYTRDAILRPSQDKRTKTQEVMSSTIAGGVSLALAGRFWSRRSVFAGAALGLVIGYVGQHGLHRRADNKVLDQKDKRTLMQKLADSRWIPIQNLTNSDYERMLSEKLEKIDVEIAMIDDKLTTLRKANDDKSTEA